MSHARTVLAVLAGVCFAAFPLLRPWGDKAGEAPAMAEAFASDAWVISHLIGLAAWMLLAAWALTWIGTSRTATAGGWLMAAGAGGIIPYYGLEAFSLHVLGRHVLSTQDLGLIELESQLRGGMPQQILFVLGLGCAAAGAVLLAIDTWRRSAVRTAAIPLAVLVVAYLPQFFAPPGLRITHGLLLGLACAVAVLGHRRIRSDGDSSVRS